ncbi:MAG: glutamate--cysteine ligase [Acidimicrobiales bacterium]|nr:glutamate--cysteine ligase [Acidimicrobiales bacterium]
MHIPFNSSVGPSLGVEVEFELVDRDTRELSSAASAILEEIGAGHPGGEHPKAKHELFECTVEIITGICQTVAEAKADLASTLAEVSERAAARNLDLVCSGTHPFSDWREQTVTDNERYHLLVREMALMAQRLQIFGVHFHVGVRSPEKAVAIANALAGYIPHLLALSASSPFSEGRDTGLASSRSKIFEGLPTAGLPEQIVNWEEFEQFMETLVSAEAIGTVREVWWDIRPHPDFGTVELRMCDGIPTLREVAAMAALAQSLVHWLDTLHDRGYQLPVSREWVLRQNKWRAARHGLDASLIVDDQGACRPIRDVIAELLDELQPIAQRLGCADELKDVHQILQGGASYERQRRVMADEGSLVAVVDSLVRELVEDQPGARR